MKGIWVWKIFILQIKKRNACYCGNTYGSNGASTDCSTICKGDSSEICGSGDSYSVYSTSCQGENN